MNSESAGSAGGYDHAFVRHLRRMQTLRSVLIWGTIIAMLFGGTIAVLLDYFARLPRERVLAKASYWERVHNGLTLSWTAVSETILAPEEAPLHAKLPVVELFIDRERIRELNSNLPYSGSQWQGGYLRRDRGATHKVKARYRGDSVNHWSLPMKSWRVQYTQKRKFDGFRSFNLNVPRTAQMISDALGYNIGEQFGILTPRAYPVHFRLNREFDGVRILLEQVDAEFLASRGLPPSRFLVGDIDTEQVYGRKARIALFSDPKGWDVIAPKGSAPEAMQDRTEIAKLVTWLKSAPETRSLLELEQILDVPATLRMMALLDLISSIHIDETHNQKFYVDPITAKLRPILWDPQAYLWDEDNRYQLDLSPNRLYRTLLLYPQYREMKNRFLWEAMSGDLSEEKLVARIDQVAQALEPSVRSMPVRVVARSNSLQLVTFAQWQAAVSSLKERVKSRHAMLRKMLQEAQVSCAIKPSAHGFDLEIATRSHPAVMVDTLHLRGDSVLLNRATVNRTCLAQQSCPNANPSLTKISSSSPTPSDIAYTVHEVLSAGRDASRRSALTTIPGALRYEVVIPASRSARPLAAAIQFGGIEGRNLITGERVTCAR